MSPQSTSMPPVIPAAATFARASLSMSCDLSLIVTRLPKRRTISMPVAPTPQPTSSTRSFAVSSASENSSSVERCPPGRTTFLPSAARKL